ncbi:MAG: response regulator transcription factor [Clostridium sp.]|uniref:response regulator transcription factor n=1 Tax=Clostridium sp. TaxID=1506 RepID=UPI003F407EC3
MAIRVLICDDDSLIRESLKVLLPLKGDIEIVGEGKNGREGILMCQKYKVDVALVDIRMPEVNGVQAVREIVKTTDTKCLILTTFDDEEYISEAIEYGAKGYILKGSSPDEIVNSINAVFNKNFILNEKVFEKIQGKSIEPSIEKYKFSEREIEIIKSISEGLNNKEISEKLFISEGTVRNYITGVLEKTGLKHRTAIAVNYLKGNF